jgi:hypothetical protein
VYQLSVYQVYVALPHLAWSRRSSLAKKQLLRRAKKYRVRRRRLSDFRVRLPLTRERTQNRPWVLKYSIDAGTYGGWRAVKKPKMAESIKRALHQAIKRRAAIVRKGVKRGSLDQIHSAGAQTAAFIPLSELKTVRPSPQPRWVEKIEDFRRHVVRIFKVLRESQERDCAGSTTLMDLGNIPG